MKSYLVLLHHEAYEKALLYLGGLRAGTSPGKYLGDPLRAVDLLRIKAVEFMEMLMRTKLPQIFAESDVYGDGTDWNRDELSILGDINFPSVALHLARFTIALSSAVGEVTAHVREQGGMR
jgi:hypothetical protein